MIDASATPVVTGPLDLRLNRAGSWLNVCRFDARQLGHVHRAALTIAAAAEGRLAFRVDTLGGAAVLHIDPKATPPKT